MSKYPWTYEGSFKLNHVLDQESINNLRNTLTDLGNSVFTQALDTAVNRMITALNNSSCSCPVDRCRSDVSCDKCLELWVKGVIYDEIT